MISFLFVGCCASGQTMAMQLALRAEHAGNVEQRLRIDQVDLEHRILLAQGQDRNPTAAAASI